MLEEPKRLKNCQLNDHVDVASAKADFHIDSRKNADADVDDRCRPCLKLLEMIRLEHIWTSIQTRHPNVCTSGKIQIELERKVANEGANLGCGRTIRMSRS